MSGKHRLRSPFALLLLVAYAFVFFSLYLMEPCAIELRVGTFAGSNWDVPQGESYAYLDHVIARFEAEHPGVKVTYQSGIRKSDYTEWLAGRELAGEMPDVFLIPQDDFNLYAGLGALLPLDALAKKDDAFALDDFYPAPLAFGRSADDAALYALPAECVPRLMFVNRTLLDREGIPMPQDGWTWDDFLAICQKVTRDTDGDGRLDQFGAYGYNWQDAAVTSGAELFREDGKASYFTDERIESVVRFANALHQLQRNQVVQERDFDIGHVAFRPFNFAAYRTYKPYPWRIKKATDFEWDCIHLPRGPEGRNTSPVQTLLMGISAKTKERQLAWEFLKAYCHDRENQTLLLSLSAALPTRRGIIEEAAPQELFGAEASGRTGRSPLAVSQVIEEGTVPYRFPRYVAAMRLADQEIQKLIDSDALEVNSMNRIQKEINDLLLK